MVETNQVLIGHGIDWSVVVIAILHDMCTYYHQSIHQDMVWYITAIEKALAYSEGKTK
jgi:hypothetical protein